MTRIQTSRTSGRCCGGGWDCDCCSAVKTSFSSFSSGIVSGVTPFVAVAGRTVSFAGSTPSDPFGLSSLEWRICLGDISSLGVDSFRIGDTGRLSGAGLGNSRSFFLPKPLNAELRLVDDFRSGDEERPYGWALFRRPRTVPKRFRLCRPLCLCSFTASSQNPTLSVSGD